jgi:hypothetical protein
MLLNGFFWVISVLKEYSVLGNIPFKQKLSNSVSRRKGKFPNKKGGVSEGEGAYFLLSKINQK